MNTRGRARNACLLGGDAHEVRPRLEEPSLLPATAAAHLQLCGEGFATPARPFTVGVLELELGPARAREAESGWRQWRPASAQARAGDSRSPEASSALGR